MEVATSFSSARCRGATGGPSFFFHFSDRSWDFRLGKGEGRAILPSCRVLGRRPLPVSPFSAFLGLTALSRSRVYFGPFELDSARSRPRLVEGPSKHDPTVQASP